MLWLEFLLVFLSLYISCTVSLVRRLLFPPPEEKSGALHPAPQAFFFLQFPLSKRTKPSEPHAILLSDHSHVWMDSRGRMSRTPWQRWTGGSRGDVDTWRCVVWGFHYVYRPVPIPASPTNQLQLLTEHTSPAFFFLLFTRWSSSQNSMIPERKCMIRSAFTNEQKQKGNSQRPMPPAGITLTHLQYTNVQYTHTHRDTYHTMKIHTLAS
jgi:hypothetical protein